MRFVIVTGMSGAGKSQVVNALEDAKYYCIDNMPPSLIAKFAELCFSSNNNIDKIAMVCDIRSGAMFGELLHWLHNLKTYGFEYELLFLDASDEVLIKRYKETRRKHPLSRGERLPDTITRERAILKKLKLSATHIIDTSELSLKQLKAQLLGIYGENERTQGLVINVVSFGFKHGIPLDADLMLDVRFLPNPYYVEELKPKCGLDDEVADYVMSFPQSVEFRDMLYNMIDYLIPYYTAEGKSQLVIAIGCTGGQHRSVTFARYLTEHLNQNGARVYSTHRDCKNA